MQQKKISAFLKFLIVAFILLSLCLLICRNHFIFGTVLILGRWIFVLAGLLLLFFTTKRISPKRLQYALVASVLLICFEFIFTKLNEAHPEKVSTETEVTLLTYNLFFKNKHPDVILKQIKETNPDIFVVQELTPQWVHLLSKSFEHTYPYKTMYINKGTHGMGIYSKYKLSGDTLLLNESKKPFAQLVNVRVLNKKIQLINVHTASPAAAVEHPESFFPLLSRNYTQRENQFEQIEHTLKNNPAEISVLTGDLNTTPYEPIYRNLRNTWIDVFNETGNGNGATFPNTSKAAPFLRLDYILIRGAVSPVSAKVLNKGSSDHLALVGKIKI
jgi:endonuclease/exonuclease/phosphatase (EEP) superfamily protein YafD